MLHAVAMLCTGLCTAWLFVSSQYSSQLAIPYSINYFVHPPTPNTTTSLPTNTHRLPSEPTCGGVWSGEHSRQCRLPHLAATRLDCKQVRWEWSCCLVWCLKLELGGEGAE